MSERRYLYYLCIHLFEDYFYLCIEVCLSVHASCTSTCACGGQSLGSPKTGVTRGSKPPDGSECSEPNLGLCTSSTHSLSIAESAGPPSTYLEWCSTKEGQIPPAPEMPQQVITLAALLEYPGSILALTTLSNSSPRESDALLWTLWALYTHGTQIHMQATLSYT